MDMESLMAQAKTLQNNVAAAQEKLAGMRVKGLSKNGACIVDMTGKYDVIGVTLNPNIKSADVADIESAILTAFQDAKSKADDLIDNVMSEATAGMPLPQ
ncbi:MAG: YbaB/EbfC family nucleoid-associated protein [Alphaproteobacteria bacterium]|nr:YbaB/EbfC family nucleoid-associated protein [Alphaproteobacteria bacterium]